MRLESLSLYIKKRKKNQTDVYSEHERNCKKEDEKKIIHLTKKKKTFLTKWKNTLVWSK